MHTFSPSMLCVRAIYLLCLAFLFVHVIANPGHEAEPEIEVSQAHEQLDVSTRNGAAAAEGDRDLKPVADVLVPRNDRPDEGGIFSGRSGDGRGRLGGLSAGDINLNRAADPVFMRPAEKSEQISSLTERVTRLTRELEDVKSRFNSLSQRATESDTLFANFRRQAHRDRQKWNIEREKLIHAINDERDSAVGVQKELNLALQEQRRAFTELLEEKRLLSRVVRDEQRQLMQLQEKIQNPNLALWLRQRAERAAVLLEMPETDAMAYYAKLYMQPKIGKMRHRLAQIERRVEKTVDHVLPARYGAIVAVLLCFALVAFPVCVSVYVMLSLSRNISLRQYVLLCNVFLSALALGFCISRIVLQQDPLQTLYEASEQVFMLFQFMVGFFFPLFMVLLALTIYKSRRRGNGYIFACEFMFYVMVGLNYRRRVWEPAMVGEIIHTNTTMYFVYLIDFICMTVLTISAAKGSDGVLPTTFRQNTNAPSYVPVNTGNGNKTDSNAAASSAAKRLN